MLITDDFKQAIAGVFYDKTFDIYDEFEVLDSRGWSRKSVEKSGASFVGNIKFDKLDKVAMDYGIVERIDATITTNEIIEVGTKIGYQEKMYIITRSIPFDSHNLLIAQQWLSKSKISISA